MNKVEAIKRQRKSLYAEFILGIIVGVFGNLMVTSLFEGFRVLKIDQNVNYPKGICIIFGISFIVLISSLYFAFKEIKKS